MNNKKRNKIEECRTNIENIISILNDVSYDEQTCADNLPEQLQSSDMYCNMTDNVDYLEDAVSSLEEAVESLENIQ